MATIERFEDVVAWQRGRELTNAVYAVSGRGRFARDYDLRSQIRRACISITSNIAEGFDRGGRAEFIQFLSTAKGSAGEVRSQLYVARDQGYLTQDEFNHLASAADDVGRLIGGFMQYLQQSTCPGVKYRRAATRSSSPRTRPPNH